MPTVRAPEIDRPGLQWFNVPGPLSLAELRGRLVILDFWTFCCINCLHVLPTLRRVEEAFPEEVVVIGVHSPKFPAERDPANLAAAIARHGIRHPVVNDPEFQIWSQYAVRAWPTLVVVSPDGAVIGQHSGEPDPDRLLAAIAGLLDDFRQEGRLEPRPLDLAPASAAAASLPPAGRLRFPGKIKPAGHGAWAVADAGHNQVVLFDDGGAELARYGSGEAGFADGAAGEARFDAPQGLVADDEAVWVADTGNHAIRRIERESGIVTTLAGTGRRGGVLWAPAAGTGTALASPWDLERRGRLLFFANAGTHQLGQLDLDSGRVARLAGAGPEGLRDSTASEAHLAQPSGLALSPDGGTLWFADAETSSVRALDLASGAVTTLAGSGLFDFGHVNGPLADAQFQHCLGLAPWKDGILVADSYNAALRLIDPGRGVAEDFDGGRFTCADPVCLPLGEPAGLWVDGVWAGGAWAGGAGRVLVADTNNHRILEYRPAEGSYRTWVA
ncbi:thioredoxin-like domain-containing protein [Arenibaculum sp.]|uniref:thioredoxin-like domain-containing protein n=1 Tax=Arenibaculum sp. TaxID=2865862 RepID=UPI002E0FBAC0|nr:thioredoxin-like domain-containing protein [Arenibaculum sp.]